MTVHLYGNNYKAYFLLLSSLLCFLKLYASRKKKHDCVDVCFSQNLLRVLGALTSYSGCSVHVWSLLADAVYFHFSSSYRNTKLTFRWSESIHAAFLCWQKAFSEQDDCSLALLVLNTKVQNVV